MTLSQASVFETHIYSYLKTSFVANKKLKKATPGLCKKFPEQWFQPNQMSPKMAFDSAIMTKSEKVWGIEVYKY